jgi:hypothetical protein
MKSIYVAPVCLIFVIAGFVTDIAGLVSLGLLLVSCWLLFAGGAVYLIWALFRRFRILNRKPSRILILTPLLLSMFGASGLLGIILSTRPALMESTIGTVNDELKHNFDMDQSDRFSGRFFLFPGRDKARLARTRAIVDVGLGKLSAEAKYHAAMILQHGESSSDFELAYTLASSAAEAGFADADKLSEAAYDRWQLSMGRPQKYGTQSKINIGITGISSVPRETTDD